MGGNIAVTIDEDDPRSIEQDFIDNSQKSLDDLGLSDKITKMLNHDHWSIEGLAQANIELLVKYDGIGIKRAQSIIDKAQELIVNQ